MTTVFTKEQNDLLVDYANDMKNSFEAHAKELSDKLINVSMETTLLFDQDIKRLTDHGNYLKHTYEKYTNQVIEEVKVTDESVQQRHVEAMKEMRIASIAAIYASGRGVETSIDIVKRIEDAVNNTESHI